ncbi:hypothetical protein M3P05_10175 [Sansalvadorimonas sp. 2012CJ34-2]|uniref:Lipoprotein n=1 Tax=Parendozoicomonas callyspongiae TaxID=2942213 RepID=A0ABT0PFZ4_9GAMM|nr:hypothetical protein [Sansalvadorimonas sp. 2012CJ34-2]MCL6270287.1 hypothetical protein [Sansalvadorimonas sp. 2012CJ34-2]
MTQFSRAALFSKVAVVLPAAMAIILSLSLGGCGKKDEKKKVEAEKVTEVEADQVTVQDIVAGESYDCDDPSGMTADKRFWCKGFRAWQDSDSIGENSGARDEFIAAWKLGYLDASQGRNPAIDNLQSRPVAAEGYETGYIAVLDNQGVVEYDCTEGDETDNEYRDRWCEASASFNKSNLGSSTNAVLRNNYINGFMAGRAIALTIPTSMESLFGDAAPDENAKKPIDDPEADAPKGIQVFYKGFNAGFQAMIDTVRESVNQVMEQMQNMPGMEGMEGMPGMPGMDGMPMPPMGELPPGMENMMPPMPGVHDDMSE